MAFLPNAAGQAAEVGDDERRRLEETTARMMGRMCDGMLRAHRRHTRPPCVPSGPAGAFVALDDGAVAMLAATCQPPARRRRA